MNFSKYFLLHCVVQSNRSLLLSLNQINLLGSIVTNISSETLVGELQRSRTWQQWLLHGFSTHARSLHILVIRRGGHRPAARLLMNLSSLVNPPQVQAHSTHSVRLPLLKLSHFDLNRPNSTALHVVRHFTTLIPQYSN